MLVTALVGWAAVAAAHPAPFSFLDLRIDGGRVAGTLTVHDLDAAHELGLPDARRCSTPRRRTDMRRRWPSCSPAGCGW